MESWAEDRQACLALLSWVPRPVNVSCQPRQRPPAWAVVTAVATEGTGPQERNKTPKTGRRSAWDRTKIVRWKSRGQNVRLNLSRVNTLLPGLNSPAAPSMQGRILLFGPLNILICFISARYMHANCIWIAHQYPTILWMLEFFFIFFFLSRLEII